MVAVGGKAGSRKKVNKLLLFTYLNLGFLLCVWGVETFIAENRWWGTLLTYMPQQPLLIPTALLLLIALFWRQWKSLLFNLPALIVCLLLLGVNLPLHRATGAGMPVRVMTWNVHQLAGGLHAINAAIKHEAPDIVLLQEVRTRLPLLAESPVMQQAFPGWFMAKSGEVAILSRYRSRGRQSVRLLALNA